MPTTNAPSGSTFPDLLDLWFQAYIAALHRVEPISAGMIADQAVRVAVERWGIIHHSRG